MRWSLILVFVALQAFSQLVLALEDGGQKLGGSEAAEVRALDLRAELANMSPEAAGQLISSAISLENMVVDVLTRKIIAAKAEKEGLAIDPLVERRMRLAKERVLYEAYLERRELPQVDERKLEQAAKEEYLAYPEKYTREMVRASHILLKRGDSCSCDAKKEAERVLERIKAGESFEALAKKLSIDGSAARGGDLGVFSRGKMVPAFENAVFALKRAGELSEIVETQFGYHIIRLDEKLAPVVQSFDEVKASLMEPLRLRLRGSVRRSVVGPIRAGLTDSVDREAVKGLVANPSTLKP